VRLDFKVEEMNDVLKSLTVHDPEGQVVSVSYDSHKDLAELLQEIALELPEDGGMVEVLASLKGAEVKAEFQNRSITGAVVGLDKRSLRVGDHVVQEASLSLWSEKTKLINLPVHEITSIELLDESLRADLSYCLETLLKTHKRDTKQLSIFTRGQGNRKLHLSYMVEAPAWKSSYRILLPKDSGQPLFWEGWALVDNPRDEDWEDIELTLVAGLPISFRHDLYSPRYVVRREIEVEREATVGPIMPAAARPMARRSQRHDMDDEVCFESADAFAAGGGYAEMADPFAPSPSMMMAPPSPVAAARAAEVIAQDVGELFHYKLRHPVTVKRNQSALVPIVGQEAEGGKVVLYNAEQRKQNPFAAVELTNTTGLTLEGGPLLVIEDDSYAGEAMLDTLKPKDRRIVPYAVDLAVSVTVDHQVRDQAVHLVKAYDGYFYTYSARLDATTYEFRNNDERRKKCWIEFPLRHGWELFETPAEEERTATHYRFVVNLEPNSEQEFRVQLKYVMSQSMSLSSLNLGQVEYYRQGNFLSAEAEAQIRPLLRKIEEQNEVVQKTSQCEQLTRSVTGEIERIRTILPSLGDGSDEKRLRSSYVVKIEEAENRLQQLRQEAEELRQLLKKRQAEVSEAARAVNFEKHL